MSQALDSAGRLHGLGCVCVLLCRLGGRCELSTQGTVGVHDNLPAREPLLQDRQRARTLCGYRR